MIVAGFGFRATATEASLRSALERAAQGRPVHALAAPEDKCAAPALAALARAAALPVIPVADVALRTAPTPTQSAFSRAQRGVGSVAEAAALVAAGGGARIISERRISGDRLATCALAEGGLS